MDKSETSTDDYRVYEPQVLVIGAGGGGLRAAISLKEQGVQPLVLGKRDHGDAHTIWAAGGINASLGSLDPEDRWDIHAADTLKEGHFINDPEAVELMTYNIPDRIKELQEWGCDFDLTDDGKINQRYFGAQSFRRTCFVGDRTGEAILETLVDKAKSMDIPYMDWTYITKILADSGKVAGAMGYNMRNGQRVVFKTNAVIIAAGGHAEVYARSSSRNDENTGDGAALALNADARLQDMEMIQFHPTGMAKPEEYKGRLVTEAVRGEGGRLFNADGERFMEEYSPKQMELDARDVVARAIAQEVREGRGLESGSVHLDISHEDADFIKERLPKMYERFQSLGIDITEEPMEVAPTTHYAMGGVRVDFATGATDVEGLFAVGETTAGMHGANRLGGNSLAEVIAFGEITGRHVAEFAKMSPPESIDPGQLAESLAELDRFAEADGTYTPQELIEEVRETMWEHTGILRDAETIQQGSERLDAVRDKLDDLKVEGGRTGEDFERAMNLRFMLPVAEAILKSSEMREESRGGHYRTDFPDKDRRWRKNIVVRKELDEIVLETTPVRPTPLNMQQAVDENHELDYHHLE